MVTIIEEKGDLFDYVGKMPLAHCISKDCAMGAGIAKEFTSRFPSLKRDCMSHVKKFLTDMERDVGCVPVLLGNGHDVVTIYNLVTKERAWHKPTYDSLRIAIQDLVEMMWPQYETEIAIPLIGCGLDGLSWPKVKEILQEEFDKSKEDIIIHVRIL